MRCSWSFTPCKEVDRALICSGVTSEVSLALSLLGPALDGRLPGAISSTLEAKRTAGAASWGFSCCSESSGS